LTILAIGVASYRLGSKSLWLDEAISADHARVGLTDLWKVVTDSDPNQGLYYVLLNFWTRLFGYDEAALRSLTVLLGALAVPAMVLLGKRLFGRATGLTAGLLLALSPFLVHYEQTARSYALLVLLVVLSSYFFVCELEQPSRATRVGFVLTSTLAFYTHYLAAFVLVVLPLTLLAVKRRAALTRDWLVTGGAIAILCAPEAVFAVRRGNPPEWIPSPSLSSLTDLPSELAGGTALSIALLFLVCYWVVRAAADRRRWPVGFVAAWFVIPVLLDFAVSKLGTSFFISYYLIIALPAFLLLAANGLVRLPGRATQMGALGLLIIGSGVGISDWYDKPSQEDYRSATRYIMERERPNDGIIYEPSFIRLGVDYYQLLAGNSKPALTGIGVHQPRIWLVSRGNVSPVRQSEVEQFVLGSYAHAESSGLSNPAVSLYRLRSTKPTTPSRSNAVGPKRLVPSAVANCFKAAGAQVRVRPAGQGTVVRAFTPDGAELGAVKAPDAAIADRLQQVFSASGYETQLLKNDPAAFGIHKGTLTSADSTLLSKCT
jgi:mannosyltransferase